VSADHIAVTDDAIPIRPVYPARRGAVALAASAGRAGAIQRLTAADAGGAARQFAEALAGGADGAELVFAGSAHPIASAIAPAAARRLADAIADAPATGWSLRLDAGGATAAMVPAFAEVAAARGASLTVAVDPAASAAIADGQRDAVAGIAALAALAGTPAVRAFAIADGRLWHAAGASEVQELAAVLATLTAVLRHARLPPAEVVAGLGVALAADADIFLTIAKVRAMRLLATRFGEIVGAGSVTVPIHVETAWRTISRREPRVNALRATAGAFAALAGGADSVAVLPFDAAIEASAAGNRLARNTVTILTAEAEVRRVADPAAGSGAVEALTDALAAAAWERFQALEAEDGILAAIAAGTFQRDVNAMRAMRRIRLQRDEGVMVGVNAFVDGDGSVEPATRGVGSAHRLTFERLAEPYETVGGVAGSP
jgi:methylmalonyl-CoA mutase